MTQTSLSTIQFKKIIFDIKVGFIICLIPFLIFTHLFFSEDSNTIFFGVFEFSHKFDSNQVFIWSILISLIPFLIISILYYTINRAWRYALLPLIIILFLSLMTNFSDVWEEYKYLLSINGLILVIILLENIVFFDFLYFKKYRAARVEIKSKELLGEIFYDNYGKINRKAEEVFKSEQTIPLSSYICRIYLLLEILNKRTSGELSSIYDQKSGESFQRSDINSILFIMLATALLFLYNLVPLSIQNLNVFNIEIGNFGFNSMHTFLWYTFFRLSLILILMWCYFKIDFWWRWALLSPIIFYTYQFSEIFLSMKMDEIENVIHLSPILFLALFILMIIWKASSKEHLSKRYKELAEKELESKIVEVSKKRVEGN